MSLGSIYLVSGKQEPTKQDVTYLSKAEMLTDEEYANDVRIVLTPEGYKRITMSQLQDMRKRGDI